MATCIQSYVPDSAISHFIREYYFMSVGSDTNSEYKTVVDDGCYDFVLFKEGTSEIKYGKNLIANIRTNAFSIHQLIPPYQLNFGQQLTFFTIKVQPWMNTVFFPSHLSPGIIDLKTLYGKSIETLQQQVFKTNNFEKQITIANDFFAKLNIPISDQAILIRNICEEIYAKQGKITVNELSQQFQMPRQLLNKIFREHVHYTTKKFIIIVRIMEAVKYKLAYPTISFTELALQFDYFDQAHFNNDFRRICGIAPSKLFKRLPEFFFRHITN